MADDDRELMQRYCAGDAQAFRALYARVAPRLRGYLLRMTREPALADDLLQMTFLKLHRVRSAYVQSADPLPWLYAIAHRTFLDEVRKRKRAKVRLSADGESVPAGRAHITGIDEDHVVEGVDPELAQQALAALERLPESQRQAVVLVKLDGHSIQEAAAIAGTTAGAMKVRAHRGYTALRKVLGGKGADS